MHVIIYITLALTLNNSIFASNLPNVKSSPQERINGLVSGRSLTSPNVVFDPTEHFDDEDYFNMSFKASSETIENEPISPRKVFSPRTSTPNEGSKTYSQVARLAFSNNQKDSNSFGSLAAEQSDVINAPVNIIKSKAVKN